MILVLYAEAAVKPYKLAVTNCKDGGGMKSPYLQAALAEARQGLAANPELWYEDIGE
ncbi:hypothetical protein [Pseudidiomarina sediminum]|uniref:hypothetical protein n=1 Tax=Pseudidiomarina sediminum TaxID=431675 RepID=UPI001C958ADE|nr:hypothetical protein [Pseudidiomarina sediminum]MBY6063525.1 hypothetical protein [Pseudidiomarina sediminum]